MSQSVTYIAFAPITTLNGQLSSTAASVRYRVLLPAKQLVRRGYKTDIRTIPKGGWLQDAADSITSDTVIFSKSFHPSNEDLAENLKYVGAQIVFDVCDNHFEHTEFGAHYHRMVDIADKVVASTERMAEIIEHHTGRKALVISDPLENPRGTPGFLPRFPAVRLLWFGHSSNLDSLFAALPQLSQASQRYPIRLQVVTAPAPLLEEKLQALKAQNNAAFQIDFRPWTLQAVKDSMRDCDIVIIPSLPNDKKSVKSPNRLIESIWAGLCVVAHPIPSYEPFGRYCLLGNDLAEGIFRAIENPESVLQRVSEGQQMLAYNHSAYAISKQWEAVITESPADALRLNLGCGDKILPDYVNVDIVESRKGKRPDVLTSLEDLSMFSSNSAEEILSVHVVEHFWRWDTLEILKEWVRVLKPGGQMILECPNLESACELFLQDPERYSRQDKDGQRTMWVFYGDPSWKDPYMIHRWGFTPNSLGRLMEEAGLVDIRQEPAQFKLREPRDMRVTGTKPST